MDKSFLLTGKAILITGASSGIGRAVAEECALMGASVIVTGRNEERLGKVLSGLPTDDRQRHASVVADLSTESGVLALTSQLPVLDGVFSNAGMGFRKPIKFLKDDDLEQVIRTNTFSHVFLMRQLFKKKLLKENASCVFTASVGGITSFTPGNSLYGISKAAVESFMKFCAIEFASRQIRCNAVCPGMIITPLTQTDEAVTAEDMARDAEGYLLKRYGQPEEVARAVCFLLSDASSFIDGTSITIDGGFTANH